MLMKLTPEFRNTAGFLQQKQALGVGRFQLDRFIHHDISTNGQFQNIILKKIETTEKRHFNLIDTLR